MAEESHGAAKILRPVSVEQQLASSRHLSFSGRGVWGQTAACDGANSLPWETDRSRLSEFIEVVKERAERSKTVLDDIVAERSPEFVVVRDRSALLDAYGRKPIWLEMTKETSVEVLAKIPPDGGIPLTTFDQAKAQCIAGHQNELHHLHW